jgi:hypothetical protein
MPSACSAIASRPDVTCSPEATMASYSRASCSGEVSVAQPTSSLVLPDMAETTTATSWPASTSRLTCCATLRMRSILATDVPPNFMTSRLMTCAAILLCFQLSTLCKNRSTGAKRRVYIPMRVEDRNRVCPRFLGQKPAFLPGLGGIGGMRA